MAPEASLGAEAALGAEAFSGASAIVGLMGNGGGKKPYLNLQPVVNRQLFFAGGACKATAPLWTERFSESVQLKQMLQSSRSV